MPATWDDAFVDFTAEARASLPAEFCQRHLGGFVGPNPLTPDEQARVLAAVVARERSIHRSPDPVSTRLTRCSRYAPKR